MADPRKSEMKAEWRMWEHLIRDDVRRLEHRIQSCYGAMSTFGISRKMREEYVLGQLKQIIQETANESA